MASRLSKLFTVLHEKKQSHTKKNFGLSKRDIAMIISKKYLSIWSVFFLSSFFFLSFSCNLFLERTVKILKDVAKHKP